MKKFIICIALLLALAVPAAAANLYNAGDVLYTKGSYTLLSAVTTTGTSGTAITFDAAKLSASSVPVWNHFFTMLITGTTPSNVVVTIDGSQDGTNYGTLMTSTLTSTATVTWLIDTPAVYLRSTLVSRSNGSTNTAVTVTGVSGGVR